MELLHFGTCKQALHIRLSKLKLCFIELKIWLVLKSTAIPNQLSFHINNLNCFPVEIKGLIKAGPTRSTDDGGEEGVTQ